MVEVTQADRDAVREIRWVRDVADADRIIARHREAAVAEKNAEVARLREVERLTRIARRAYWFEDCPEYDDKDDLWRDIHDALEEIDKARAALEKDKT